MTLKELLDNNWIKIPAVTAGTMFAIAVAEETINMADDYFSRHPPQNKVMQLTSDQISELAGSNDAYAGGNPDDNPKMTKVPGLDYEFDGGVYIGGAPDFPKDRYKFRRSYKKTDLSRLFEVEALYQLIGKDIESKYKNGQLITLTFDNDNNSEIAISFKIDNQYFVGFKKIDDEILKTLQQYDLE